MEQNKYPLIGITTSEFKNVHGWGPQMYGLNETYSDSVLRAGGLPVLLPFVRDTVTLRLLYERLDGLLFSGGDDINPAEYGEEPIEQLGPIVPARDEIELQLMKWAIADDKPVLAICRGHQILNVALGGTLYQDLKSQYPGAADHQESNVRHDMTHIAHQVTLDATSRLASIIGADSIDTNTHHHQAIKKAAPSLIVTGRAEDGVIESVEIPSARFVIGVQSHPEALSGSSKGWQTVFDEFVRSTYQDYAPVASVHRSSNSHLLEAL